MLYTAMQIVELCKYHLKHNMQMWQHITTQNLLTEGLCNTHKHITSNFHLKCAPWLRSFMINAHITNGLITHQDLPQTDMQHS